MVTADRRPPAGAELVPTWRGSGRQVRRLWAAYAISQAGSGIGTGALPLVAILLLEASDWQISLLAAVAGIAGAAAVVPLGPWVEFHRKRPVMIGADLLRGVTLLSVPVAAWAGGLTFGQLCLVAAAQTIGTILSSAASTAYLKSLVPADRQVLVNARWESTMWTASTLGPPAGGMLVSWLGALAALLVDAASFLLSAVTLGRVRHREPAPAAPANGRHSLAEMTAGWRHIAAHPVLVRLFGHALIFGGCIVASTPLIAVLMLRDLGFSPAQYGLALGVPCAAGILGSVLAPRIIRRAGLMPTLLVAGAARCLWMAVIPFAPGTTAGLVLIIAADTLLLWCAGVFNPAFSTYRMRAVADGYLARVTAAWAVSSKVAQPIVIAAAGVAAAVVGARTALLGLAGVLLASMIVLPWRSWTTPDPAAGIGPGSATGARP
ncbi:MFS transporter [Actinoplanes campanulatus]|uniref:MFS transporter n=1 Tax=Actinoplanes campanulatus TaxID=113559 RepID=UPI001943CC76|nr:MFS transporter [Actinoplanes campanulatus]GID39626.1 MFS transporter [Actinoplanes campanulatus]